ncbi:hypothetical protein BD410DRAFT_103937 [Rickenella mellea]|uniref:Uncharacterized protein n=1 Tax=Rickenella mellea TaxID=50990 RepID=A0A4Y7PKF4_9AGAM|nr:hypothetical protein BD410DRAFT_103937 [Rickenella mellea]
MPDITIINETPNNLNVAFRFVAPANWTNTLEPGNSWTAPLSTMHYTFEVRIDVTDNRFSPEASWATAGDIVGGWFAGAASVVTGTLSATRVIPPAVGLAGAGFLMNHALEAGARFAQNPAGMVISVGVWIPFHNKTFAVRFQEDSGFALWDVDEGSRVS